MKLYTLKECFEKSGSVFPFTVDWYWGGFFQNRVKFTEINKDQQVLGVYLTKGNGYKAGSMACHGFDSGIEYSKYSIDRIIYEKDFDKLIEE